MYNVSSIRTWGYGLTDILDYQYLYKGAQYYMGRYGLTSNLRTLMMIM